MLVSTILCCCDVSRRRLAITLPSARTMAARSEIGLSFVGTFGVYPWLAAIGLLGILITAALFLQMLQQLFFGDLPRRWADFSDLGRVEVGALTVMGLLIVAIGIYPA